MVRAGLCSPAWLVSSPKQEFRLLRSPSPNACCETWLEHLRCGMVRLGCWSGLCQDTSFLPAAPGKASQGNHRDVEIQGLAGDISRKESLFSSLSWKLRICPIVKSQDKTVTMTWIQGQPFCASTTQLGAVIGTRSSIVQSKWVQAKGISVYIWFFFSFGVFLTYFSVTNHHSLVKPGGK